MDTYFFLFQKLFHLEISHKSEENSQSVLAGPH